MSPAKQALLVLVIGAVAVSAWAVLTPEGRPWLDRAGLAGLSRAGVAPEEPAAGTGRRNAPTAVVTRPATLKTTTDDVVAIGDGRALRSVTLMPEAAGRVKAILVSPGQKVEAGDVILSLDDAMARIAHDRAVLVVADARTTAERTARLRKTGAASDLQDIAATLALRTAELAEQEAAVELDRHQVRAPISGHVGLIIPEVGDQITTATEITRIDDRSAILVEFRLPERFAARVTPGEPLTASVLSGQGRVLTGRIHAVDNRIDAASRSFRLQAEIDNDDDSLRSGMAFSIAMSFPGQPRIAVDPLAVQWNSSGAFLWVVREARARQVPVRVLQRGAGEVLVEGDVAVDEPVVTEGVQTLRPGSPVVPVGEAEPTAAVVTPGNLPAGTTPHRASDL